jgi:transcription antitermination factor NusG
VVDILAPIADETIEIIRSRIDDQGKMRAGLDLKRGEEVRIDDGRLKDIIGIFDGSVSPKGG